MLTHLDKLCYNKLSHLPYVARKFKEDFVLLPPFDFGSVFQAWLT